MKSGFEGGVRDLLRSLGGGRVWILGICAALLIIIGSFGFSAGGDGGLEPRVAEMCALTEGAGECRVMLTYSEDGEVYAAAVICEGGDSTGVKDRLTDLICSLFGIGAHRVSVLKME